MLWKNYSFFRKAKGKPVEGINSPDFRRNVTSIAKELTLMERTAFEDGIFFASSPVLYRDKRRMPRPEIPDEMTQGEMTQKESAETPDSDSPADFAEPTEE